MKTSSIDCPVCYDPCAVPTPDDACVFFYRCECCGALLRPAEGDCCVICSYGAGPCPPKQNEGRSDDSNSSECCA